MAGRFFVKSILCAIIAASVFLAGSATTFTYTVSTSLAWSTDTALNLANTPGGGCNQVIYDSRAANFADWQTNAPGKYFWDSAVGAYHYAISDGAEDYAYRQVPYDGGSFALEFDWMPHRSGIGCNHRFGLFPPSMTTYYPNGVQTQYTTDDNGMHMYLGMAPSEGTVTDDWPFTVNYTHDTWYHNVITFDAFARSVRLRVTRVSDGTEILNHTVYGPIRFSEADRLALSSLDDFGFPGATAEGYIRNIVMTEPAPWVPIYDSRAANFSDWQTNHPSKFYWDQSQGAYHYAITDAAEDYAFLKVPYQIGSFRLAFDWQPVSTDANSNHTFGMWGPLMSTVAYPGIYLQGRSLTGVGETGLYLDVTAFDDAGTWPTLADGSIRGLFENGVWYRVTITYDKAAARVNLRATRKSDGQVISDETLRGASREFGDFTLDRLAMSSVGDYGYPGATAQGFVRDVVLSAPGIPVALAVAPATINPCTGQPAASCKAEVSLAGSVRLQVVVRKMDWTPVRYLRRYEDGVLTSGQHEFTWDGRDDRGQVVPEGWYRICADARNECGAQGSAPRKFVLVQCQPPQCTLSADRRSFKPCKGERTGFTCGVNEKALVRLTVYDMKWQPVHYIVWDWWNGGSYPVAWDGRDVQGKVVPEGWYRVVLQARDVANLSCASTLFVRVQCSPPSGAILSMCSAFWPALHRACTITCQFRDDSSSACFAKVTILKYDWSFVRDLPLGWKAPGIYRVAWDGRDARGNIVPTGSYRVVLRVRDQVSQEFATSKCCINVLRF
jgi:hypothetical protein